MNRKAHFSCRLCGKEDDCIIPLNSNREVPCGHRLFRCENCGFVRLYPLPGDDDLRPYYFDNYWSIETTDRGLMAFLYALRSRGIRRELQQALPPKAKILDWGAGDGAWVNLLRRYGFEAWGFDPFSDPGHADFIIKGGPDALNFQDNYFDAITCFHVLEHLPEPLDSLNQVLRLLKPGGLIIIEVPNIASWGFTIFKHRWQPLQLPTHLNHFSPGTLRDALEKTGCTTLKIVNYSSKASKAAVVLSLFPGMTPKIVREKYHGRYPLPMKILYLLLQFLAYPYVWVSVIAGKGCIIRGYFKNSVLRDCTSSLPENSKKRANL